MIRRMIPKAQGGDGEGDTLVLFCRLPAKSGSMPYVCMVSRTEEKQLR